jgi:hypothetical protein
MHMLSVWDRRLKGYPPLGDTVRSVDENTSITDFVAMAVQVADKFNKEVYLRICCHGRDLSDNPSSQGGNGLVFCKGDLGHERLSYLAPLRGKLRGGVDLLACGAAYINPGYGGRQYGDGNYFCFRMAQILATNVRASTAEQVYSPSGHRWFTPALDFGPWEGTVLTYGPKGNVIKVEHGAGAAAYPEPLSS